MKNKVCKHFSTKNNTKIHTIHINYKIEILFTIYNNIINSNIRQSKSNRMNTNPPQTEQKFQYINYIYYLLAKGFGKYSHTEFMELLAQARVENHILYEENRQLKQEIEIMNKNIVTILEKDLLAMRKQVNDVIKPKPIHEKTVEELDI